MNKSHKNFTKFSEVVNISSESGEFDFFDILFRKDSQFFVDPALIKAAANRPGKYQHLFIRMSHNIDTFFEEVVKELEKVVVKNTLFKYSNETQATYLGYSEEGNYGRGNSDKILMDAFRYVKAKRLIELGIITQLEHMTLYTKAFLFDRMSDLIISLIRQELAEFSLMQSQIYGFEDLYVSKEEFPMGRRWDADQRKWVKFSSRVINPSGVKILLIPRVIVTRNMVYTPDKFLSEVFSKKQEDYKNKGIMTTEMKNGDVKGPSYDVIRKIEIQDPDLEVKEYLIQEHSPDVFKSFKRKVDLKTASFEGLSTSEIDNYREKDFKKA